MEEPSTTWHGALGKIITLRTMFNAILQARREKNWKECHNWLEGCYSELHAWMNAQEGKEAAQQWDVLEMEQAKYLRREEHNYRALSRNFELLLRHVYKRVGLDAPAVREERGGVIAPKGWNE